MEKFSLITQRVLQNNQEFLLGVFKIGELLKFTRYTEYTILGFDEDNDNRPITKDEVQRKLNPSKVNAIVNFLINDPLAIFPTNLVIAIPNHVIDEQTEQKHSSIVEVILNQKVFNEIEKIDKQEKGDIYLSIIDGQHRVRGIEKAIAFLQSRINTNMSLSRTLFTDDNTKVQKEIVNDRVKLERLKNIELPVTFFIDPVLEYQAMIFSTINRTQTKVPPNLVYSLFGLSKNDSPQKTLLNIVNTLNGRENSPFYKRIKLAGSSSKKAKEFYQNGNPILSQATVITLLLKMICSSKQEEENARHFERSYFIEKPNKGLPFRKYYGKGDDARIIKILFSFFTAIRQVLTDNKGKSLWDFNDEHSRKAENILHTTVGFMALINVLKEILSDTREEENDKIDTYVKYISKMKKLDLENVDRYSFNQRGRKYFSLDMNICFWPPSNRADWRLKELEELSSKD